MELKSLETHKRPRNFIEHWSVEENVKVGMNTFVNSSRLDEGLNPFNNSSRLDEGDKKVGPLLTSSHKCSWFGDEGVQKSILLKSIKHIQITDNVK